MSEEILKEILAWSVDRSGWQRDALRRLFTAGPLTATDFDDLADLCKAAQGLSPSRTPNFLTENHLAIVGAGVEEPVGLLSLTHHHGVNALAPEQTMTFGPSLTIAFGQNAAGKSGYTRILKNACRSRSTEREILGNVLSGEAPLKAQATIRFRHGDKDSSLTWTADATPLRLLAAVSVFDSHSAPVYLSDKTDVAFRPFSLDVFDQLADGITEVRRRLETELEDLKVAPTSLPQVPSGTRAKVLLDSLTSLTRPQDVQDLATLSPAEEGRLGELRDLERDLRASDPKRLHEDLLLKAQRVETVAAHVGRLAAECGDPALEKLKAAVESVPLAQKQLDALRNTALTGDLLMGTGETAWRQLWEAAAAFSGVAYQGVPFPVLSAGAHCPLCQQVLGTDARERLAHFQEYAQSTAQAELRRAEADLAARLNAVTALPIERDAVRLGIAELSADDSTLAEQTSRFIGNAARYQEEVKAAEGGKPLPAQGVAGGPERDLAAAAKALRDRATLLAKQTGGMAAADRSELADLEGRITLRASLQGVFDEIERKKRIAAYAACLEEATTQAVTRKSTELTKRLVTDQLQTGFRAELEKLKFADLPVEIRPAGGAKGALFHQLVFSNAPGVSVGVVVSEGESRVLSLAAFLTELQTAGSRSAILFDDPVSSLDHIWRRRIAARLVEEASTRQVIVFTHDVAFLRDLMDEAERRGVPCHHQYVRQEGRQPGVSSEDLPWIALPVKKRIGILRKLWQEAAKLERTGPASEFEKEASRIYGLLRSAWEQAVEEVLLDEVVERLRPSVETRRVRDLHDITRDDCSAVEDAVTECSRWLPGHDQAAADGTPFPSAEDLKKRIDDLEEWVRHIRDRRR